MWAAYEFGSFSGIIRLSKLPATTLSPVPIHWRGRENGEGEMSFGEDCTGSLEFLGGGRIRGTINIYGDLEFAGRKVGPVASGSAIRFSEEWKEYNEEAYE